MRSTIPTSLVALAAVGATLAFAPVDASDADERPTPTYAASAADAVIRPGAGIITPGRDLGDLPYTELDAYCTYNFIFHDVVVQDPETGEWPQPKAYIGTAAHCTDELGEVMGTHGGTAIGEVVYDSDLDDAPGADKNVDFSLIELYDDQVANAHPEMLGFPGAPVGIDETVEVGTLLQLHGYGMGVGQNDVTRDRYGVVLFSSEDEYTADTGATFGDSGGPLANLDTGEASGIISRYGFERASTDIGPTLTWILEHLERAGLHVELATVAHG